VAIATTTTTTTDPEAILAKYVAAVSMDDFDAHDQHNAFAVKEHHTLC